MSDFLKDFLAGTFRIMAIIFTIGLIGGLFVAAWMTFRW